MGFPVTTIEGTAAAWGSSGMYTTLLAAMRHRDTVLSVSAPVEEITGLAADVRSIIPGLAQWSGTISGMAFATPRLGNVGIIAYSAGGYTAHAYKWSLTVETEQVHDITAFASGSPPVWRLFRPDRIKWSGTVSARHDSSTNPVLPHLATSTSTATSLPTLTLTYGLDATANTLAGAVSLSQLSVNQRQGGLVEVDYSFEGSGNLTSAGTNPLFASGAIPVFLWDESGTNMGLTITAYTSKTYTGNAFLRSVTIECEVGKAVSVSAAFHGTGALTGPS